MYRFLLALALTAAVAAPALAQRGAPYDRARGPLTVDLTDGEPISFFLEVSRELGLNEAQKSRLMNIRRRLRAQNEPYMNRLDSLREMAGIELGERGSITRQDADALRRFQEWSKPVIDSIRINNDAARGEARSLLDDSQRTTIDSLTAAARARRPQRRDRPPGALPLIAGRRAPPWRAD